MSLIKYADIEESAKRHCVDYYHKRSAIITKALSLLDVLYRGRIGLGLRTGEAMNEVHLGYDWLLQYFYYSAVLGVITARCLTLKEFYYIFNITYLKDFLQMYIVVSQCNHSYKNVLSYRSYE